MPLLCPRTRSQLSAGRFQDRNTTTKHLKHRDGKQLLKDYVIEHWAKEVGEALGTLCPVCVRRDEKDPLSHCIWNLLPITTKGEKCPYYTYDLDTKQPPRPPTEHAPTDEFD
jgi:hypothetical protein